MLYALIRLAHLGVVLILAGAIVIQNMAVGARLGNEDVENLSRVNKVVALAALLSAVLGLLLWFVVGKPAAFYNSNVLFHAKLGLFLILGLLTLVPSLFLRQHAGSVEAITVPATLRIILRLELLILLILPILAYLMARGIGN